MTRTRRQRSKDVLLGEHRCELPSFPFDDKHFDSFLKKTFRALPAHKRMERVCRLLIESILRCQGEAFLLKAVLAYLARVNSHQLLDEPLTLPLFEFWLNHFSGLDPDEQSLVRAKIAGKHVPRDTYSTFFPIGMGKTYPGSHFVTAHLSPDIDTTVASFWGWMDAFAAKVAEGQHIWSLPGGAPSSQVKELFQDLFGEPIWSCVPRVSGSMTQSAMDLLIQSHIIKAHGATLASQLDHGVDRNAILYINDHGHYHGDWRGSNTEPVRQITLLFTDLLRWFENAFHMQLISLFKRERLARKDLTACLTALLDSTLNSSEIIRHLSSRQRQLLEGLCQKILGMPRGLKSTFRALLSALSSANVPHVKTFLTLLHSLDKSKIFDAKGNIRENRPKIFHQLHEIIEPLSRAMRASLDHVDRLDVVMQIKHDLLGYRPQYATLHSDVEELRCKMGQRDYLTVVIPEENGALYPLGIIPAWILRKPILGTISQRDFSNREEMRMASYLEVISVVDHHKTDLETNSTPQAIIGDTQSANVLVAEQTFAINDRYSTGGMAHFVIEEQLASLAKTIPSRGVTRVMQRLLQRRIAIEGREGYFVDPQREYAEYLSFLHAILDDTDLLSKVTKRDVVCMASLLNRMKSLTLAREVEIVHFDGVKEGPTFAKEAAQRLLQNRELYSLYDKIYAQREQEVEESLRAAARSKPSQLFGDTKEQNGCCRIGQIKLFASNISSYQKAAPRLRTRWLESAQETQQAHPEIDLHMEMISTIASAKEVYRGKTDFYSHRDELWIWVASTQTAQDHLASFLSGFQTAPEVANHDVTVEFLGPNASKLEEIFARNFKRIEQTTVEDAHKGLPIAILRFRAGSINSRKASITPYLPHLVS